MTWRRAARWSVVLAGVWVLGTWPPPIWWRDHWPKCTAMMRERARAPGCPASHPLRLATVPPVLERMVVIGEDSRFWTHHGIDPEEIGEALGLGQHGSLVATARAAWNHRDRMRGASTITQQLAKNLYLSPSRSPLRKLKEAVTALRLELALPKTRILELYLGIAEWGPGIWGVDAASEKYFAVSPAALDETAAAALAATLPQPRASNPAFHPERMMARRDLILARYHGVGVQVVPEADEDTSAGPDLVAPADTQPAPPDTTGVERDSSASDSTAADSS